jgi:hypothetical protein
MIFNCKACPCHAAEQVNNNERMACSLQKHNGRVWAQVTLTLNLRQPGDQGYLGSFWDAYDSVKNLGNSINK